MGTFWICANTKCSFKGTLKQGELCPKCRQMAQKLDLWSIHEIHLRKMEHKGIYKFWVTYPKVKCPHCFHVYDKTLDRCPHCGVKQ